MKTDEKQKDNRRNNHEGKDKSNQNTSQNMDHVIMDQNYSKTVHEIQGGSICILKKHSLTQEI